MPAKLSPRSRRRQIEASTAEIERAAHLGGKLEDWFAGAGRTFPWRTWRDPYRTAVTEVLLQRTRADAVAAFVPGFLSKYPSWIALAKSNQSSLEADLAPLGLQRRRATSLRALATIVSNGDEATVPEGSPGVGQYVERAIAVGVRGDRVAMVDSNFVRILRRVFGGVWMSDYRYDRRLQQLAFAVISGSRDPRAANWAALDLGALICKPRSPTCSICPLSSVCEELAKRSVARGAPT